MPVIEPPMKRPADYLFKPGHFRQSFEMRTPQLGIRMVKAQERAARLPCARVQLRPARGRVASNQPDRPAMAQLPQNSRGLDRGNHPFSSRRVDRDAAYQVGDKIIIAPDRNDHADKRADHGITLTVTAATSGSSRLASP